MTTSLVLTIIGTDRPGLIEAVSDAVHRTEGNWLESRLARLAGKFAGVVLVSVPDDRYEDLKTELDALGSQGLRVVVEEAGDEPQPKPRVFLLELVGHDRPGIVKEISHLLAYRGVNVEELTTHAASAPMSGYLIFQAKARLILPEGLDADELTQVLEGVANDLMVDVSLASSEE